MVSDESIVQEALKLVDEAAKKGLLLRIMGAAAVRIRCPNYLKLHMALKRKLTDIDFAAYEKQQKEADRFFSNLGYKAVEAALTPGLLVGRRIFIAPVDGLHIDIFFDRLEMCHTINFKGRLESDFPTIPLAELFLEKMQIVRINEKDIKDVIILFLEKGVGESDKDQINAKYIAKILSSDWGFCYTVTSNLEKIRNFLAKYDALTDEHRQEVADKIDLMLNHIEKEPKSLGWKMRAKVGPMKKWYRDVEEFERAEWLQNDKDS